MCVFRIGGDNDDGDVQGFSDGNDKKYTYYAKYKFIQGLARHA